MKKIFLLVVAGIFFSSCEEFLNTEPVEVITAEQLYNKEGGLDLALAGVYDKLGTVMGGDFMTKIEIGCDESYYAYAGTQTSDVVRWNAHNAQDPILSNWWTALYEGVNKANDVIANINLAQNVDEAHRQVVLGEALFLRGYYYFLLQSRYGGVQGLPLRLEPTTTPNASDMARTPGAQVYVQILKDMQEAETKVQAAKYSYCGRVSKTVVQGMIARVCLHMAGYPINDVSKYQMAKEYAKKVIDSGERSLNVAVDPNPAFAVFNPTNGNTANNAYRQLFLDECQNKYNTNENIWEVEYAGTKNDAVNERGSVGTLNGIQFQPTTQALIDKAGYSYGWVKASLRLYQSYDANGNDLRRDYAMQTFSYNATGDKVAVLNSNKATWLGRSCSKWLPEYENVTPKNNGNTSINFPILRYADVLLMYAEAELQTAGPTAIAYDAVNQVRRRGYGFPIGTANAISDLPAGLSKDAFFRQGIFDERMRELCFEGVRRSDLIRWGLYVQEMNASGNENANWTFNGSQPPVAKLAGLNAVARHQLFPIPVTETNSNKLITQADQNPGW